MRNDILRHLVWHLREAAQMGHSVVDKADLQDYKKLIDELIKNETDHIARLLDQEDEIERLNIELPKWIPVKERLPDPKEYDWVLGAIMTTEFTAGKNYYLPPHVVEYRNGEWWSMGSEFPVNELWEKVTHWMPLPKLPKEDKK